MDEIRIGSHIETLKELASHKVKIQKRGNEFKQFLKDSLKRVNEIQKEADLAIQKLAIGKTENIHETMIAIEKAELSFQLMMQIRNKIIEAYNELMRMQL